MFPACREDEERWSKRGGGDDVGKLGRDGMDDESKNKASERKRERESERDCPDGRAQSCVGQERENLFSTRLFTLPLYHFAVADYREGAKERDG